MPIPVRAAAVCLAALAVLIVGLDCRARPAARRRHRGQTRSANGRCWDLNAQGITYTRQGKSDSALGCFREALKLAQDSGLPERAAASLQNIAMVYEYQGEFDSARHYYELAGERTDTTSRTAKELAATTLMNQAAYLTSIEGQQDSARRLLLEALALARQVQERHLVASIAFNLASICMSEGKHDSAFALYNIALQAGERNPDNEASALSSIARLHFMHGRLDSAHDVMSRAMKLLPKTRDRATEADVLCDAGVILGHLGQYGPARECFTRACGIYANLDRRVYAAVAAENIVVLAILESLQAAADEVERERALKRLRWHDA